MTICAMTFRKFLIVNRANNCMCPIPLLIQLYRPEKNLKMSTHCYFRQDSSKPNYHCKFHF